MLQTFPLQKENDKAQEILAKIPVSFGARLYWEAEIAQANKTLNALQGENTLLEMEIAQKMSLDNIEEYATTQLNMGKVEQYQIENISLTQNDEITVMKDDSQTNFFSTVYARIFGS